jgi:exodeoxyribonuclease VII small subunit
MSQSTDTAITFESGYRRLQDIAERLSSDEVPVHEMCDLFAEGKGLEQALAGYLAEQKARIEAIERGEGMRAFRVVAPGAEAEAARAQAPGPAAVAAVPPDVEIQASRTAQAASTNGDGPAPGPLDEPLPF